MKYGFTDYNLNVEEAIRELDNFANYGIDMGEKDHEKFFIERWLKVRDVDLSEVEELKAEIEDLSDQLDEAIDEDEWYELNDEKEELEEENKFLKMKVKNLEEELEKLKNKS